MRAKNRKQFGLSAKLLATSFRTSTPTVVRHLYQLLVHHRTQWDA